MKIVAVGLKYYKCYEATEVVPCFFGSNKFAGFIGENGVGKSAILEALNSFFTGKNWIRNKTGKKGEATCMVAPIIGCTETELRKEFSGSDLDLLKKYSKVIEKNLNDKYKITNNEKLVFISCAVFQNGDIKIFDTSQLKEDQPRLAEKIRDLILSSFKYIYIGAEIDIDSATGLNSKTHELIRGAGISGEITKILQNIKIQDSDGEDKSISQIINDRVIQYLDTEVVLKLQAVDKGYNYKNLKTGATSKISEKHISELATQALFGNRELTKKIKSKDIGISDMSSGQRRKAFLDFILVMISNLEQENRSRIILAIDEPEVSVDAGSRIQQFEKLFEVAKGGPAVMVTTHWYGWLPQLLGGNAVLIKEENGSRQIFASDISNFLEKAPQKRAPYEMRMMFDFLSSLGAWAESEPSRKFVICEGLSDYNLLIKHFHDYKIIPLKGVDEVVRMYKVFSDYYFRVNQKPSNAVFLIDTDPDKNVELSNISDFSNLKRISRDSNARVCLVSGTINNSEKCSIEDVLAPEPFLKAIKGSIHLLPEVDDKDFVSKMAVVYPKESGIHAFGLDEVKKRLFKKVYHGPFKLNVSEIYTPSTSDIENFRSILKMF